MSLSVEVHHRQGDFLLDAHFESTGRLTALFGRSGAGKSSLVAMIAGLVRPDHGRIAIDGELLVHTEIRFYVPAHRRRVGYVFQEGRLFPHMTVRRNLLYGRWFTPKAERYVHLDDVVELLGLGSLLDRSPERLSGGEKQRVAIGRALLASPRLLLLDEPLAALDEGRKAEILPYIERLRDEIGLPIVYVSHSISEVARLATTVVAMADGKVTAVGRPSEILSHPRVTGGAEVAEAGVVLRAVTLSHDDAFGLTVLETAGGTLTVPRLRFPLGTPVRVRVRARDVMLAIEHPKGLSALNVLPVTIQALGDGNGHVVDVYLDAAGTRLIARITRRSVSQLGLVPGQAIYAVIKSIAFDGESLSLAPHYGIEFAAIRTD
jgi:molybdate transport system ATP-binding protein